MPRLSELDVVNQCLATMGDAPLVTLDDDHPMVPPARKELASQNMKLQSQSWWFNQEQITLFPDPVSGYIMVSEDILTLDDDKPQTFFALRGRRLYNLRANGQDPYVFHKPVALDILREVPFDDLPMTAMALVAARTVLRFQSDYDGDNVKYQRLERDERESYVFFHAQHIRNVKANLLHTSHVARILSNVAPSYNR